MSESIVVENLSKKFQLGQLAHETMLRDALIGLLKNPFKRSKRTREFIWALKDVSFSVAEGEVVGIIGRNGAGKSTLLKVLSKITYPTSGHINVAGRVASLLEVGTGFHEELSGRENIYLNGSILGMKKHEIDSRLEAIVEFADVARHIDTPIKRYSSGQRLRLGFAVAAHLEPDILLVDEVLAVGDVGFQKKCLNAMEEMHTSGRTVLFVSHNMAAVENLCPRTIWIENGQVCEDGPSSIVIKNYMSSFESSVDRGINAKHRTGTGEIQIVGIDLMSTKRKLLDVLRTGDDFVIRLHYDARQEVKVPHFGIELLTDMGTLVTAVSTWHTGYDIPDIQPGTGYVDLEIRSFNLMPSWYYIKTIIATYGFQPYDVLDNCLRLDVQGSDFYNSGRGIARKYGINCFHVDWKHSRK